MGTLRITGGILKGRIIQVSAGILEIRPPMDRMRESIFSILNDISGMSVLDIFAGSGIFSFEALSRGASSALCIEKDKTKIASLKKNAMLLGVSLQCKALPAELFIKRSKESFDLVFCDPPFPYKYKPELLNEISSSNVIAPNGKLVFHYPQEDVLPESLSGLVLETTRKYGRSCINIYQKC
mgnify:CR=1 FL=1